MAKQKDPLAPLELGVSFVLASLVLFTVVGIGSAAFGDGSVLGIGGKHPEACVQVAPGVGLPYGGTGETGDTSGLRDGVRSFPDLMSICDTAPSAGTTAWQVVRVLPGVLGLFGLFGWLLVILRRMRRDGYFADRVPGSVTGLGEVVIAWALLDWVVTGFVDALLLSRMSSESDTVFLSTDFPIVLVLVGLGLMTLGRVLTHAVTLRLDSEATI